MNDVTFDDCLYLYYAQYVCFNAQARLSALSSLEFDNPYDIYIPHSAVSSISDGGNDVYDGGNVITVNSFLLSIQYSASGRWNCGASSGDQIYCTYFTGSVLFLFSIATQTARWQIAGNVGTDGGGLLETQTYSRDATAYGFRKTICGTSDPSINHMWLTNTDRASWLPGSDTLVDDDSLTVHHADQILLAVYWSEGCISSAQQDNIFQSMANGASFSTSSSITFSSSYSDSSSVSSSVTSSSSYSSYSAWSWSSYSSSDLLEIDAANRAQLIEAYTIFVVVAVLCALPISFFHLVKKKHKTKEFILKREVPIFFKDNFLSTLGLAFDFSDTISTVAIWNNFYGQSYNIMTASVVFGAVNLFLGVTLFIRGLWLNYYEQAPKQSWSLKLQLQLLAMGWNTITEDGFQLIALCVRGEMIKPDEKFSYVLCICQYMPLIFFCCIIILLGGCILTSRLCEFFEKANKKRKGKVLGCAFVCLCDV